jgi:hypothetical protein
LDTTNKRDLSRIRVLLFGAFGNGNLGDMYQALAVRHHLLGIGLDDGNIFACSMLDFHDYPFPEGRKLPASYLANTALLNSQFSALLVGGGGLLGHPHEPLQDPQWARRAAIPIMFVSVGTNGDCVKKSLDLLDRALVISGRDGPSLATLASVTARACLVVPDPILCMPDAARLLEFDCAADSGGEQNEPIDVLWILRAPVNEEESRLVQFVAGHIGSDRRHHAVAVTESGPDAGLQQHMPGIDIHQPENLRAFLKLASRAGRIFSMRYHGVIFAALAGKVAYGLSQRGKVESLYSEHGLPGCYVDSLERLAELLFVSVDERRSTTELSRRRNLLRLEFLDRMKAIGRVFSSVSPPRQEKSLDALCESNLDAYDRAIMNRHAVAASPEDGASALEQAIEAGLRFVNRETAQVKDWVAVAHLLARADRLDEALAWISRAVTALPGVTDHCRLQASVLERLQRFEEALQVATHALNLRPDDAGLVSDVERISSAYVNALRQRRN